MSEFASLIDTLIRLQGVAKAANAQATPIRAKVTAHAIERYIEEGSDRWARDAGEVSLVKPKPYVYVTSPNQLAGWLDGIGRHDLVRNRPTILDAEAFCAALDRAAEALAGEGDALDALGAILNTVDVPAEPVSDWHEHTDYVSAPDGTLSIPDGEVIPGAQLVTPPIERVQVRPGKALVDAEQARLGGAS